MRACVANDKSVEFNITWCGASFRLLHDREWENRFRRYQRCCCCCCCYSLPECTLCFMHASPLLCTMMFATVLVRFCKWNLSCCVFFSFSFGTFRLGRWIVCCLCVVRCCSLSLSVALTLAESSSVGTSKFTLIGFSANRSVVLTQHTSLSFSLSEVHINLLANNRYEKKTLSIFL